MWRLTFNKPKWVDKKMANFFLCFVMFALSSVYSSSYNETVLKNRLGHFYFVACLLFRCRTQNTVRVMETMHKCFVSTRLIVYENSIGRSVFPSTIGVYKINHSLSERNSIVFVRLHIEAYATAMYGIDNVQTILRTHTHRHQYLRQRFSAVSIFI